MSCPPIRVKGKKPMLSTSNELNEHQQGLALGPCWSILYLPVNRYLLFPFNPIPMSTYSTFDHKIIVTMSDPFLIQVIRLMDGEVLESFTYAEVRMIDNGNEEPPISRFEYEIIDLEGEPQQTGLPDTLTFPIGSGSNGIIQFEIVAGGGLGIIDMRDIETPYEVQIWNLVPGGSSLIIDLFNSIGDMLITSSESVSPWRQRTPLKING